MYKNKSNREIENTLDKHNWASGVKKCLDSYGFSEVWINGGVGNEMLFLHMFKQRIIDCYKQEWCSKLNESDRLETYRSFKSWLNPEKYLYDITIMKFRTALTRFRLGVSGINFHKRYSSKSKCCPNCNVTEDEHHFLLICPLYQTLRDKYLTKAIKNISVNVHLSLS